MERLDKFDQNIPVYGGNKRVQHERILLKGDPFTDEEFPPEFSSLVHPEEFKGSVVGDSK